jgi:hypothetical protein
MRFLVSILVLLATAACRGQGIIQITFDGPPPVAPSSQIASTQYIESGMIFRPISSLGSRNFARNGGGIVGFPDNGTAFVQAAFFQSLMFNSTNSSLFGVASVDLAGYSYILPDFNVPFVGYRPDGSTMITTFSGTGTNFQTFSFPSDFSGFTRVEIPTDSWSLDNLVIQPIPEPSSFALFVLGGTLFIAFKFCRRKNCNR